MFFYSIAVYNNKQTYISLMDWWLYVTVNIEVSWSYFDYSNQILFKLDTQIHKNNTQKQKDNWHSMPHIDGLVQNSSFSIANALEILQPCTKPLM